MPGKHALLSASASHRWIICPPSARLCEGKAEEPSPYARQGTEAHALCEHKLLTALGRESADPSGGLEFLDEEMEACSDAYCRFAMERYGAAKLSCRDPLILVEQRLDFSRWAPGGYGTGDCLIVSDGGLHVIDFKYGLGIRVEAEGNTQMLCYALGALDTYDGIYDIGSVEMTIFQPRLGSISSASMDRASLLAWAGDVLAPAARLALEGGGGFKAGSHCRFCRAKASCAEYARHRRALARQDFLTPADAGGIPPPR